MPVPKQYGQAASGSPVTSDFDGVSFAGGVVSAGLVTILKPLLLDFSEGIVNKNMRIDYSGKSTADYSIAMGRLSEAGKLYLPLWPGWAPI